jgi:hypothetical protein
MTQFKQPICTLHNTSQLYLTVLHKYMDCDVKWNGEKIRIGEIIIYVIFECECSS